MLCTNCYDKKALTGATYKSDAVLFRDGTYYCEYHYTDKYLQAKIDADKKREELEGLEELVHRVMTKTADEKDVAAIKEYEHTWLERMLGISETGTSGTGLQ